MYISRTFDSRAAQLALLLIRRPIKSRRYPAKQERLITPEEFARLCMAHSPVNRGGRFSNMAPMASSRSFDGRNAEFHAAT